MKKVIVIGMFATLVACSSNPTTEASAVDSTTEQVDAVQVDTCCVDVPAVDSAVAH